MQPIYNAGFFSFENKAGFLFGIFKDRFFIFPPSKRHFSAKKGKKQAGKKCHKHPRNSAHCDTFYFRKLFFIYQHLFLVSAKKSKKSFFSTFLRFLCGFVRIFLFKSALKNKMCVCKKNIYIYLVRIMTQVTHILMLKNIIKIIYIFIYV